MLDWTAPVHPSANSRLDATSGETIEQQIINREQKEKLLRQIEALEKKCRLEKQTHKKYELHQEVVRLKQILSMFEYA